MTSAPLIRFLMRMLPLQSVLHVVPHLNQAPLKPVPTAGSVLAKIYFNSCVLLILSDFGFVYRIPELLKTRDIVDGMNASLLPRGKAEKGEFIEPSLYVAASMCQSGDID